MISLFAPPSLKFFIVNQCIFILQRFWAKVTICCTVWFLPFNPVCLSHLERIWTRFRSVSEWGKLSMLWGKRENPKPLQVSFWTFKALLNPKSYYFRISNSHDSCFACLWWESRARHWGIHPTYSCCRGICDIEEKSGFQVELKTPLLNVFVFHIMLVEIKFIVSCTSFSFLKKTRFIMDLSWVSSNS